MCTIILPETSISVSAKRAELLATWEARGAKEKGLAWQKFPSLYYFWEIIFFICFASVAAQI